MNKQTQDKNLLTGLRILCALKTKFYLSVFLLLISCLFASEGIRAKAMGGAYGSVTGDVESFLYNPAGIGSAKDAQVQITYNPLYPGVADIRNITLGYLQPFLTKKEHKILAASVYYNNFVISDIISTDTFGLGFAASFKFLPFVSDEKPVTDILLGLKFEYVNRKYIYETEYEDLLFSSGNSKAFLKLGLGATVRIIKDIAAGVYLHNLNQPDQGLAGVDKLPLLFGASASYEKAFETLKLLGTLGMEVQNSEAELKAGVEAWFFSTIAVRAGVEYPVRNNVRIAAGLGFKKKLGKIGIGVDGSIVFIPAIYHSISKVHNYAVALTAFF